MFEKIKRNVQPLLNIYHLIKAVLANLYYGFPSQKLTMIGITGTDGKTTTTHLIHHVLCKYVGNTSMISSIDAFISGKRIATGAHVTTPDSIEIQDFLRRSINNKDKFFIMECTSHALNQNRLWGIKFEVSAITNITQEHLDYHKSYEKYVNEKIKLLMKSDNAIINKDDKSFLLLSRKLKQNRKKYLTYSLSKKSDFNFNASKELNLKISKFNMQNYLAAYSVLKILKIPQSIIEKGFRTFKIPPVRMETIYDKDFKIIIDFAHTPNSFENILVETKTQIKNKKGKIIHVFGSAGLRDYAKRPLMGYVSSKYANLIIVTEEDYRTEDLNKINSEIIKGIKRNKFKYVKPEKMSHHLNKIYSVIPNRKLAIKKALDIVKKNDVILITGKSHENTICRGKKEYFWNEKKITSSNLKIKK